MAGHGLSPTEVHVLTYLRSYAPCSIGNLHRVFGYKRSTLTSLLDRLCERRLASRAADPEDRRTVILRLTAGGSALADKMNVEIRRFERSVRRKVSTDEMQGFRAVMAAIASVTGVELRSNRKKLKKENN